MRYTVIAVLSGVLLAAALMQNSVAATAAPYSKFSISSPPPPGFEDLGGEQTSYIDIRFGGRIIASGLADFDASSLNFDDAREVISEIPLLTEPSLLRAALEAGLSTTDGSLCVIEGDHADDSCERTIPRVASITFNADLLEGTLHINPTLLATSNLPKNPYLKPTSSELGFITKLAVTTSGSADNNSTSSVTAKSVLSKARTRMIAEAETKDAGQTNLKKLLIQYDAQSWQYELGTFRTGNGTNALLEDESALGFRVRRSLAMRKNSRLVQGNEITLFLPERSRVDIRRNGVLLDSRFYGSGNQRLNTSRLPDGAYPISVKISNGQGEKIEHYNFVRHSQLPPRGILLHYFSVGKTVGTQANGDRPSNSEAAQLEFGTAKRMTDHLGASVGQRIKQGNEPTLHASIFGIYPRTQFHLALASASRGTAATTAISTQTAIGAVSISAQTGSLSTPRSDTNETTDPDVGNHYYISYTTDMAGGNLQLSNQYQWDKEPEKRRETRIAYTKNLRINGKWSLNLNSSISWEDDDRIVQINIDANRYKNGSQLSLGQEQLVGESSDSPAATSSLSYSLPVEIGSSNLLESLVSYKQTSKTQTAFARGTLNTAWSQANIEIEQQEAGASTADTRYSGTFDTAFATNFNQLAFGVLDNHSSALIALVNAPENEKFSILVDDQPASTLSSGKAAAIGLRPYSSYKISLSAAIESESLLDYDATPQELVLLPGNLSIIEWTAVKARVVILQAIEPDGSVISNANVENVKGFAATDNDGWLQVELTNEQFLDLRLSNDRVCRIELQNRLGDSDLQVFEEPVVCSPEQITANDG